MKREKPELKSDHRGICRINQDVGKFSLTEYSLLIAYIITERLPKENTQSDILGLNNCINQVVGEFFFTEYFFL